MRRLAMRGIKSFWIGLKRAETGFGAKMNRLPAIFGARKILRVGIVKDSSAKGDEVRRANLDELRFAHNTILYFHICFAKTSFVWHKLPHNFYAVMVENFFLVRRVGKLRS